VRLPWSPQCSRAKPQTVSVFRARRGADPPSGVLRVDGWIRVPVRPGQTVTGALLCAGVLATSRSLKYRRPRGPFCLQGDCGTCLVRIDGRPNLRACMVEAKPGMEVESQNRQEQGAWDPNRLVDAWIGPMFDHHHFVLRPRWANQWMQTVARRLSGLGTLPDPPRWPTSTHEHRRVSAVVIGGGVAGQAAFAAISKTTRSAVLLDRRHPGHAVFGLYAEDGVVAAGTDGRDGQERLTTFETQHIVIATGTRPSMLEVSGNDRPGVFAAQGLAALLQTENLELAADAVVIGQPELAAAWGERLNLPWFSVADVAQIRGEQSVEAIELRDGRVIPAQVVALAEHPNAASELGRQGGAPVAWTEHVGFAIERDETGRCSSSGPWQLWACGAVTGVTGRDAAIADGTRVGSAVAQALLAEEARS